MGCCGGNKPKPSFKMSPEELKQNSVQNNTPNKVPSTNPIVNLGKAMFQQPHKLLWFKDGITGLAKCFADSDKYSAEEIVENRDKCRGCEYSTKEDGKLTTTSQCMAPDPTKNGAACGCFILCKTQVGSCQLNKWTHLTISANKTA